MARTYKVRKAQARLHVKGRLPRFNEDRAIKRAQEKGATALLALVRQKAAQAMQGGSRRHQPTRSWPGSMVGSYRTNVRADGSISLYNLTKRAAWFEKGTQPHFIFALNHRNLKFSYGVGSPFVYTPAVAHPGQPARPVMVEAMNEMTPVFERNLKESIEEEWNTVGAR